MRPMWHDNIQKHDNINEWLWMQIFSVGKSADSISNKWQKISYYRREWGASGTANRMTTFRAPRRDLCGMLIGSRAMQDVYKQPGSMNPQVASRSKTAETPAWFWFFSTCISCRSYRRAWWGLMALQCHKSMFPQNMSPFTFKLRCSVKKWRKIAISEPFLRMKTKQKLNKYVDKM